MSVCLSVCLFVCLFVCLRVRSHNSQNRTAKLRQFLCTLTVCVARSSSNGVAICYVLPVLLMTSCFHRMAPWHVMYMFLSGDRTPYDKHNSRNSNQILLNVEDRKYSLWLAPPLWGGSGGRGLRRGAGHRKNRRLYVQICSF